MGPGEMMMRAYSAEGDADGSGLGESSSSSRAHGKEGSSREGRRRKVVRKAVSNEQGGVKAEYELVGG